MNIIDRFNDGYDFSKLYQKDIALKYCVLTALKYADGHSNRLSRDELVKKVHGIWHWRIDKIKKPPGERRIRNTIRMLRKDGALIISTGGTQGGYWKEDSFEEVKVFEKEFRKKALDMLHTNKRVMDAARRKYGGQTDIWSEITKMRHQYQAAINILED